MVRANAASASLTESALNSTEGDAVDVGRASNFVGGHPVGDRVDAGRELDGSVLPMRSVFVASK